MKNFKKSSEGLRKNGRRRADRPSGASAVFGRPLPCNLIVFTKQTKTIQIVKVQLFAIRVALPEGHLSLTVPHGDPYVVSWSLVLGSWFLVLGSWFVVRGSCFGVWGLGFGVWGLGFGVGGLGFGARVGGDVSIYFPPISNAYRAAVRHAVAQFAVANVGEVNIEFTPS